MGDKTLGARLRSARENAGMKLSAVCDAAEIPNIQTLSAYERGTKMPTDEVLVRLSGVYNIPVKELLEDMNETKITEKKRADYVRQLVEAATALNLGFVINEDPYNQKRTYALNLLSVQVDDFFKFAQKWSVLCQLHNDGIISLDEYRRVVLDRLNELDMD